MNCQTPSGGCTAVPAFKLTFQSAPSKGCHGMTWIEATCRSHATTRTDQVRVEGGSCIAADPLPDPAPTIEPSPVGLDSISPVARGQ